MNGRPLILAIQLHGSVALVIYVINDVKNAKGAAWFAQKKRQNQKKARRDRTLWRTCSRLPPSTNALPFPSTQLFYDMLLIIVCCCFSWQSTFGRESGLRSWVVSFDRCGLFSKVCFFLCLPQILNRQARPFGIIIATMPIFIGYFLGSVGSSFLPRHCRPTSFLFFISLRPDLGQGSYLTQILTISYILIVLDCIF